MNMYINGVDIPVESTANGGTSNFTTTGATEIGHNSNSDNWDMNGTLDDIRVYDRVLSSSEISDIYTGEGDPRKGLVGEWTFDEGSGTTAYDTSKWTSGVRQGKALEFDGSDDSVLVKDNPELDIEDKITISAWIKPEETIANERPIIKNEGSTSNYAYSLAKRGSQTFKFWFRGTDSSWHEVQSDTTYTLGQWYFVTGTYDGTTQRLYIDGEQEDSNSVSTKIHTTDGHLTIGNGTFGESFNGEIDEARIYSRALTPHQVSELYDPSPGYWSSRFFDAGNPTRFVNLTWTEELQGGTDAEARVQVADQVNRTRTKADWDAGTSSIAAHDGLVGYWRFEDTSVDGSGGTVKDWSGQGNDGTAKNAVDTSAAGFRPQSNAYRFERNDRIEISHTSSLAITDGGTGTAISAWVNPTSVDHERYQSFIRKNNGGGSDFFLAFQNHGDLLTFSGGGVETDTPIDQEDYLNRWRHITGVNNGTHALLYVDGRQLDADPVSSSPSYDGKLFIGEWAGSEDYIGRLDEVRIYNSSLSPSEVRSSYRSMTWTSSWMKWPESHYDGPTPISRWEFSRGAGQTVEDVEGSNDGTLGDGSGYASDDPTWVQDCRTDGCMHFDGVDDGVKVPDSSSLDIRKEITMSAWMKLEGDTGDFQDVIRKDGAYILGWIDQDFNPMRAYVHIGGSWSNIDFDKSPSWFRGEWHHIAATYDGNQLTVYRDGQISNQQSLSGEIDTSGKDLMIGDHSPSGDEFFNGSIDDARIYNTTLTASEIQSVMTSPKQPFAAWQARGGQDLKPLAHWTFDEGTGQKAYDQVGSNDGDLGGSTSSESGDPTWVSDCRYRGCLDFDGSDDEVKIANPSPRPPSGDNPRTVSVWVKPNKFDGSAGINPLSWGSGQTTNARWSIYINDGNWGVVGEGNDYGKSSGTVELDEWQLLVAAYDGETLRLIRNGDSARVFSPSDFDTDATEPIMIGTNTDDRNDEYFHGLIDDVRIYNRSLSNSSIHALYNAPSSSWSSTSVQVRTSEADPEDPDLVGSWSFEGVGQTVVDSSGEAHHGTLGDNASESGRDARRTDGYSGQGLEFDGSNDRVNLSNTFLPKHDFAVSVWVKLDNLHGPNNNFPRFVSDFDGGDTTWSLGLNNNQEIAFGDYDSTSGDGPPNWAGVQTDTWYHVLAEYETSETSNIYLWVNGKLKDSVDHTGNALNDGSPGMAYIGSDADVRTINATIDEVRIYNTTLSNATIRALYNLSDFTPASRFNQGSFFDVNATNNNGVQFEEEYLQYKINSLTGDFAVPTVEKASVAHASGWTGFSTDATSTNLSLPPSRYGQVQVNLSTTAPENSSAVEDISLHTETVGTDWLCDAPGDGDWVVTRNCTIDDEQSPPGNVEVRTPHKLNITATGALTMDFTNYHLLVESGAQVLVDALATLG